MRYFFILLFLLCSCSEKGKFTLHEENDYFDFTNKNEDKYYTQGLKLSYTTPIENKRASHFSAGHQFYNPQHKRIDPPFPNERPYAGYLYGEYAKHYYTEENTEDTWGIQGGVIGPWALGKEIQNGVHDLLGDRKPEGWDHQLDNELGLVLQLERKIKTEPYNIYGFNLELIGNGRADLGNISTLAGIGGIARYGKLPNDFGPTIIKPTAIFSKENLMSYYTFIGAEQRAVARNIFLDGNTFEDSPRVTKHPFVTDFKFGLEGQYKNFTLIYSIIYRSNEYKDSPSASNFGSVDLSYEW